MDNREGIEILRKANLRTTPQRLAIVREVFSRHHPTVAEVFEAVRSQFPTIGLATVYNTLRTMTECSLVKELPFADATRFDVNIAPHVNLVCRNCGAIEDSEIIEESLITEIRHKAQLLTGFQSESQRIDLYGLCRQCSLTTS